MHRAIGGCRRAPPGQLYEVAGGIVRTRAFASCEQLHNPRKECALHGLSPRETVRPDVWIDSAVYLFDNFKF